MLCLQFLCSNSTALIPPHVGQKKPDYVIHKTPNSFVLDVLTVYNPVPRQCDSTPLITASNKRINKTMLQSGRIRWMALSRDLLKRWGGHIHYGDTINLSAGDKSIDGLWVVQDTMHQRFRKQGDLLFDANVRSKGKWTNVIVTVQENPAGRLLIDSLRSNERP